VLVAPGRVVSTSMVVGTTFVTTDTVVFVTVTFFPDCVSVIVTGHVVVYVVRISLVTYLVVVGPGTVVKQFLQSVTVMVEVVRVVMTLVVPFSVVVCVTGQTVVVVYVIIVVVSPAQRGSRAWAKAVEAKAKRAKAAFMMVIYGDAYLVEREAERVLLLD
jgi:hypothetical protein